MKDQIERQPETGTERDATTASPAAAAEAAAGGGGRETQKQTDEPDAAPES